MIKSIFERRDISHSIPNSEITRNTLGKGNSIKII
jgi:hypothetical protein